MARFAFYLYVRDLPEIVQSVSRTQAHLRSLGRPLAADALVRAYGQLRDDLLLLGKTISTLGTEELRKMEKHTRVRPEHGVVGKSLNESLLCEALEPGLLPGSVGIADQDFLNAEVPWWITNEVGSSARVGGRIFGYFYGDSGASPPDPSQFREHPLFAVGTPQDPISGLGIIRNPIPARHFIEGSIPLIDREWRSAFEKIRTRFEGRLVLVAGMRE